MAKFFTGTFFHKLDSKGRVSLPADFRDVLRDMGSAGHIVVIPGEAPEQPHVIYSLTGYERLVEQLDETEFEDEEEEEETRWQFIGLARRFAIDDGGRIVLPADLQEAIGLTDRVAFVGDASCFQLWQADVVEARNAARRERPRTARKARRFKGLHG